jgi:Fe-S-cluster containining protein
MDERDAGDFGEWLDAFKLARSEAGSVDVPCGECTACCRSGQLIPVEPDESDALAHISKEHLAPMPGEPGTYALMHDASGRCSQLTPEGCSVYAHRPRACRTYDCRIFPAAGVRPDEPLIAEAAQRWRFTHASPQVKQRHADVSTAAVVLGFPGGLTSPVSPTQHALSAIDGADEL